jgi:hypothetical protein
MPRLDENATSTVLHIYQSDNNKAACFANRDAGRRFRAASELPDRELNRAYATSIPQVHINLVGIMGAVVLFTTKREAVIQRQVVTV